MEAMKSPKFLNRMILFMRVAHKQYHERVLTQLR